jgi:O-antigen ligase
MRFLIVIGLLLTPFSTSVDSGLPVLIFGLPFLAMAVTIGFLRPSVDAFVIMRAIAPAILAAAAAVFTITLLALFAPFPDRSLLRVAPHLICYVLVFLLIARHRGEPEALLRFALTILAVSGAVLSVYYILHLAFAVAAYGADTVLIERYAGGVAALPWGGTNVVAAPLIFPHAACVVLRVRYKSRWTIPALALILLAVLLTTSRAGTFIHGSMLLLSCILVGRYRALLGWLLGILLLFLLYAHRAGENLELLISTRFSGERELSNGRFDSFVAKWDYIVNNIMSPVGYYGSLNTWDITAHNVFLTVLVEQGLLGLSCMLLFLGCCSHALFYTRELAQPDRECRRIIIAGSLLAFANLQVEDANFTQPYMVYFWIFFLVVMAFVMQARASGAAKRTWRSIHPGGAAWSA